MKDNFLGENEAGEFIFYNILLDFLIIAWLWLIVWLIGYIFL